MKIIRVAMPKQQAKKKIAMPKQQAKKLVAMPLPKAEYPDEFYKRKDFDEVSGYFDEDMDLKVLKKYIGHGEFDKDGNFPYPKYKGHGEQGLVYDIGGGKVLKITRDDFEFNMATNLVGKRLPCVVQVYKTKQINDESFVIVTEMVNVLSDKEKSMYELARSYFQRHFERMINISGEEFIKILDNHLYREKYNKTNSITDYSKYISRDMIIEIFNMYRCLKLNGFKYIDANCNNIGRRDDGTLVLLDIGGWSK